MKPSVKLLGALFVIATTGTLVLTVPSLSASASGLRSSIPSGYSCKDVTGTITFSPALTSSGTDPEHLSGSFSFSGCTGIKGGPIGGFTAKARITPPGISFAKNSCPVWLAATPKVSIQVNYSHKPPPAQSTFAGTMGKVKGVTLTTSTIALTGKVTGSDSSSTAKGSLIVNKGAFGIVAACQSSTGLKSLTVKSGTLGSW